ncbi:hypothetical protein MmTuc01_0394 [Methanosarcina mazei Tuc01]|uniref:Transcriptional regulator n=1 Tax=Methanosarcina mazei Tuc01 TaxID=1236903 RepID=M1PUG8_METMZ|nr:hypothetical protein [Methanosarcina mazei]AGF95836.1 hypothetical protein MmTuc01_0394 [Methanosarcina mazei Tuc01]
MIVVADNGLTLEGNDFKMGEVEYEMVELLRRLNINRPVALTLACLSYLRENDWVDMREEKKNHGKGRPVKLYRLTVQMETIINTIEESVIAESKTILQNIERLKHLS